MELAGKGGCEIARTALFCNLDRIGSIYGSNVRSQAPVTNKKDVNKA